jgi:hypothetical protein
MAELRQLKCVPCRGGEPTLTETEIAEMKPQVPEWQVLEVEGEKRLQRTFKFKDFTQALAFTNQVGAGGRTGSPSGAANGMGKSNRDVVDPQDWRAAQERFHHGRKNGPAKIKNLLRLVLFLIIVF